MTIIKTFDTEEIKGKFPKVYLTAIIAILVTLTIVEIWASNAGIEYGEKYEKLFTFEKNLRMENQILENEIAKNSSLGVIASKSAELGFSKDQSIQYIR